METFTPELVQLPNELLPLFTAKGYKSHCPTCTQQTLLRPIRLDKRLIETLINGLCDDGKLDIEKIKDKSGSLGYTIYTKLKYWGFIKRNIKKYEECWEITVAGRRFIQGETAVPETMWVFNDLARFVQNADLYGDWVTIHDLKVIPVSTRSVSQASFPVEASNTQRLL